MPEAGALKMVLALPNIYTVGITSKEDYLAIAAEKIDPYGAELYRYLNFDQIEGFEDQGRVVSTAEEAKVLAEV